MAGKKFGDYVSAAKMRDIIRNIVRKEIQHLRPEVRVGQVQTINRENLTAEVSFAGDTGSINARFGKGLIPRDETAIVRVGGTPGNYYITEIVNQAPENEAYEPVKIAYDAGQLGGGGSDGSAPVDPPAITVTGGVRSLFVDWEPVDNADPTSYEVHISVTSGFTPDGTTLARTVEGSLATVYALPDATPLVPGTVYYAKVIPFDADGVGPVSNEASGTPITIAGTEIADNAITTPKLAADAVVADKLAANAVTADKIEAEAVTAAKLAANAVTADKIGANAVTTGKLAASAVTTETLAAKAVTMEKLVLADFTNLVNDPKFAYDQTGFPWVVVTGNPTFETNSTGPGGVPTTGVRFISEVTPEQVQESPGTVVTPGDVYYMSIRGRKQGAVSNPTGTCYVGLAFYDKDGNSAGSYLHSFSPTALGSGTNWPEVGGDVTIPEGVVRAAGLVRMGGNVTSGAILDFTDFRARRKAGGSLIVDGAIDGKTITGALIRTGASGERWELSSAPQNELVGYATANETPCRIYTRWNSANSLTELTLESHQRVAYPYAPAVISLFNSGFVTRIRLDADYIELLKANTILSITSSGRIYSGKVHLTNPGSTGSAANAFITSDGQIAKSTSSRKYKDNISPDTGLTVEQILSLEPKSYTHPDDASGQESRVGFIAEEAHEAGLDLFVDYDENNEPDGFQYGTWTAALQLVARDHHRILLDLKNRIEALEGKDKQ